MSLTEKEFNLLLSDVPDEIEDESWEDERMEFFDYNEGNTFEYPGVGTIERIVQWGGEGDGAPMGTVFKIGDQYFERQGTYSSWDVSEWDDAHEVEPFEKTVIRYRRVK